MRASGALLAAGVLGLLAGGWWLGTAPGGRALLARVPLPSDASVGAAAGRSAPEPGLPPLPESLRGTTPVGALVADARGRFVPTPSALDLFDYYLSAAGEEPLETIRRRILAAIEESLAPPAAAEATRLLERYLAYREALAGLDEPRLAESGDFARRLQWIRELRREHFGAGTARALFGEREALERYAVERAQIARDPALDADARRVRLEALEQTLPERTQAARAKAAAPLRLHQRVRALREAGAGEAEILALREAAVGPAAAERLAEQDRQRADWEQRLAAYRAERDALLADPVAGMDGLEALRAAHFEGEERLRAQAIDLADGVGAAP